MPSRSDFSKTLAAALIAQGFSGATPANAREIIDSWCDGARGVLLPYGMAGIWAGHHLSEIDREMPGKIGKLTKR